MKKNRLGSSELMVSEIGLGCMSLGTDERKAVALVHEALDRGVNLLDTADLYDSGLNEEFVGKAIQGRRDHIVLATKAGNRRIPGQEGWVWDASKEHIKSAVKASLIRLNTDYIDLYQLHGGMIEDPIDETIEAFEELKQEGLIRQYGISSIRPNVIREYVTRSSIISVMNPYSIVDRRAEEEVLPLLQDHGISMVARGPLASGILAGDRKLTKGYLNYDLEDLRHLREQLQRLVTSERSLSQLAIRYSLSNPTVAAVIPGASSREQLIQNIDAANIPMLVEEEIQKIRRLSKPNQYELHR
ncbi:aldo/keto reductase [Cohnella sp. WQ 127256]|uniref:aldo/keto reductase n=1 Tax=Cohnella sp. WQ 127256 TaxID=2938790 RepID=UPI0021197618|nr:aldo/keto reductase [Cohnella sp. WQ 127256]